MIRMPRLRSVLSLMVAVTLLALSFGCAPKYPAPALNVADAAWQNFRQHYCISPKEPGLKVKASLHYTREQPEKQSNRTSITIWGDFGGPVRLNASATLGKIVAMIREDGDGLLVFYPTEEKAYAHANPVLGATRLGMPFPFSLNELARVSIGDFSGLTPESYADIEIKNGHYVYTLKDALATSITLNEAGRPIIIEGRSSTTYKAGRTWRLDMERFDNRSTPLPAKLTLAMDNGEKGVLRIKSRELRMERWSDKSTGLILPDDTKYYRLDGQSEPNG